jgi:hypothetical protein
MGVLAPRPRMLDVSPHPPIDTSENFPAHVCAESPLNISPNLSEVISEVSEPLGNYSKCLPCPPKYVIVQGLGGVPQFFLGLESSHFCYLGAHGKFQNPTTIPSGIISNEPEERGERRDEEKNFR